MRAVMSATQRYFNYAIQDPLRHGRINNAYSKVFDPGIRGHTDQFILKFRKPK